MKEAIKALPLERKRRLAMQLALELAAERRKRQQAFYQKLCAYAREKNFEWESPSPAERVRFVLQYRTEFLQIIQREVYNCTSGYAHRG